MLWHKGWLETRFRLLFALGFVGFFLVAAYSRGVNASSGFKGLVGSVWLIAAVISIMLAGAGIATQPALQATKGLHGSTLFTLALPVSRFRLLAVRASLGWLEMACGIVMLCLGMWSLFPAVRETTTPEQMLLHAGTLIACATGLYSIPVLLATFLDDQWRFQGSFIIVGGLWWLCSRASLPASLNIIRAMGEDSPLLARTIPWGAIACSLGLSAVLFFAAFKVVQSREY